MGNLPEHFCDDTGLIYAIIISGKWYHDPVTAFSYRQRGRSIMHKADKLELDLLELLLMQDVLAKKKLRASTLARFFMPLLRCFRRRGEIKQERYRQYLAALRRQGGGGVIRDIAEFNELGICERCRLLALMAASVCSYALFRVVRKIWKKV